jgi:hypothetical protein
VSLLDPHINFDIKLKIIVKKMSEAVNKPGSPQTESTLLNNWATNHVVWNLRNKVMYNFVNQMNYINE